MRTAAWLWDRGGMKVASTLVVCAVLSLWGAAVALGKGSIPKGFAYAAEIRATVTYDATFTKDYTSDNVCTDDNGIDHHTPTNWHEQETIDRTALFKHITVPVVPPGALGQSAARLALKPTVTDAGHVTAENSSYDFSGTLYSTVESGCPGFAVSYDCPGSISNPTPLVSSLLLKDYGFEAQDWAIPLFSNEDADPTQCQPLGLGADAPDDIPIHLAADANQAHPGWEQVILQSAGIDPHFYKLGKSSKKQDSWTVHITGANPCSDGVACSQSVTGTAKVKLKRLFLYRTKRSYPK